MIDVFARTLSLGPLSIPVWLLLGAAAYTAGWGALRLVFRRSKDVRSVASDAATTALLIYFFVWKLTPLVTETGGVIESPLLLLYAPGGGAGVAAGAAAAISC